MKTNRSNVIEYFRLGLVPRLSHVCDEKLGDGLGTRLLQSSTFFLYNNISDLEDRFMRAVRTGELVTSFLFTASEFARTVLAGNLGEHTADVISMLDLDNYSYIYKTQCSDETCLYLMPPCYTHTWWSSRATCIQVSNTAPV